MSKKWKNKSSAQKSGGAHGQPANSGLVPTSSPSPDLNEADADEMESAGMVATPESESINQRWSKTVKDWFFGVSLLFWVIIGIALTAVKCIFESYHQPVHDLEIWRPLVNSLPLVIGEAGIAILVFALVASTIENFARRQSLSEHNDRVSRLMGLHDDNMRKIERSIFEHLLKLMLPPKMFEELLETVFYHKLYRKNYDLSYELARCPANNELLLVTTTVSYELHNVSTKWVKPEFEHYFESLTIHAGIPNEFLYFEIRDGKSVTKRFEGGGLSDLCWKKLFRTGIRVKPEVSIPPAGSITIRYCHKSVRMMADSDAYFTTLPAVGMEVSVFVQNNVPKLTFQADAAHRVDPEVIEEGKAGGHLYRWQISEAFLPSQGFLLFWAPSAIFLP